MVGRRIWLLTVVETALEVCGADWRIIGVVERRRVAREAPNEWGRSLRDREKVGLETGNNKNIGELDRAESEGPRGPRDELGAVPNLDRDRCCLLDVHEERRGCHHVVGSTRIDDKNAGDGIFNGGDGRRDECRRVRAVVDVQLGHLSGGDVFSLGYFRLRLVVGLVGIYA
jgi:hypothetical protein